MIMLWDYSFEKFLIDGIIATILFFVVNASAILFIAKYNNTPGDYLSNSEHGIANLLVRVLLPVIYLSILEIIVSVVEVLVGFRAFELRLIPITCFYWVFRIVFRKALSLNCGPMWTQIIEASLSILVALYINYYVINQIQTKQLAVLDDSNVVFQMVLIVFVGLCQLAANGIARSANQGIERDINQAEYLKLEKKLYSFRREYEDCLTLRFQEDLCLQALFYTIALVEDANRPNWKRKIERLLFPLGMVKSTGLMQILSHEKALSDKESVVLSLPKIQKIWDQYLLNSGCYLYAEDDPRAFCFSNRLYAYDMAHMKDRLVYEVNMLYGHYCGTMSIDVKALYELSLDFLQKIKKFSSFNNETVIVHDSLFKKVIDIDGIDLVCRIREGIRPINIPVDVGYLIVLISKYEASRDETMSLVQDFDTDGSLRLIRRFDTDYVEIEIQIKKNQLKTFKNRLEAKGWNTKYCGIVKMEDETEIAVG